MFPSLECPGMRLPGRRREGVLTAAAADLPAEVESFCVEFMSVKEAADLFRLVKSLQREDARVANGEDAERGHHLLRGE